MRASSSPDPLNNRGDFKLNGARTHLDTLIQLEASAPDGSLSSHDVRLQAEMEIDGILYYLIGVKDALLQEINSELQLGLALKAVEINTINQKLGHKKRAAAKDVTSEIDRMTSNIQDPLWLINELHNYSKHRAMIGQAILVVDGQLARPSLIDPTTGEGMRNDQGVTIPIIDYLEDSYTRIEGLHETVRIRIKQRRKYLASLCFAALYVSVY